MTRLSAVKIVFWLACVSQQDASKASLESVLCCSALFPLHEGLIIATDGEKSGVVLAEQNTDNVLGMTAVGSGLGLDAWVVEYVNETEVITSGKELLVAGAGDGVDVGAISARWVDTLSLPEELAGDCSPLGVLEVGSARWVLLA